MVHFGEDNRRRDDEEDAAVSETDRVVDGWEQDAGVPKQLQGAEEVDQLQFPYRVDRAAHGHVLHPRLDWPLGVLGSRQLARIQSFGDAEDEERQHGRGENGRHVETPPPRAALFDVAPDYRSNVAAGDQREGVDAHVEASFVLEEQVAHGGAPEPESHAAEKSIQGTEGKQLAVCAGRSRGSGCCDGDGDADDVDWPAAVDVGDWVPEEA